VNLYGKDDVERGLGSGLSDIDIGLRLRYETRLVAGLRFWFQGASEILRASSI